MDNFQLSRACRGDPLISQIFVGVFSADETPVLQINQLAIINTALSTAQTGSHWVLVHKRTNDRLDFFCSFGTKLKNYPVIEKKLLLSGCKYVWSNSKHLQWDLGTSCGIFCLFGTYSVSRTIFLPDMVKIFFSRSYPISKLYKNDLLVISVVTTLLKFPHPGLNQLILDLDFLIEKKKSTDGDL